MPAWKKVITSGSDASLNTLSVTGTVTANAFSGDGSGLTGIAGGGGSGIFAATGSIQSTTNNLQITGSLELYKSGSTVFSIEGSQGPLFAVTDELSGSLFSVNDISGIPIFEVFSDDTVKIGTYNSEAIIVNGSSAIISGSFSGSFVGDGSGLTGIAGGGGSGIFAATGSIQSTTNDLQVTGSLIVSAGVTGSFLGKFVGDGSGLTGINTIKRIHLATSQSVNITTTADYQLWDVQLHYDSDVFEHDTVTNSDNITVLEAGLYQVICTIGVNNNATGNRLQATGKIRVNEGALLYTIGSTYHRGTSYGGDATIKINSVLNLSTSDVIDIETIRQTYGTGTTKPEWSELHIYKLGTST